MWSVRRNTAGPLGLVGPDPLEHAAAVVQGVGEDVDLASSQSTSSPSIQIFSDGVMGISTPFLRWRRRSAVVDSRVRVDG